MVMLSMLWCAVCEVRCEVCRDVLIFTGDDILFCLLNFRVLLEVSAFSKLVLTTCMLQMDASECEARVASRTDHPTIRFGGGRSAVRGMAKKLVPPTLSEGFSELHVVRSFAEGNQLLARWGASPAQVRSS